MSWKKVIMALLSICTSYIRFCHNNKVLSCLEEKGSPLKPYADFSGRGRSLSSSAVTVCRMTLSSARAFHSLSDGPWPHSPLQPRGSSFCRC